eukprot:g2799.t1
MEEVIEVSNPRSVLPVKNRKYIRNTTEIHLAKRNIDRIENFDEFVNLEVLWLNGNRIRKLENLDENIRIKELYLQQNQISSLDDSSLQFFTFLQILNLQSNQISNLSAVLKSLSRCRFLRQLNLSKNPVSQESHYRLQVIASIPSLHVLDNQKVTEEERAAANRMKRGKKKKNNKSGKKETKSNEDISECTRWLYRDIEKMKARERKEEEREQQELLERSRMMKRRGDLAPPVMRHELQTSDDSKKKLSIWEIYTLREIHKKYQGDETIDPLKILCEMRDLGRVVVEDEDVLNDFTTRVGSSKKWSVFEKAFQDSQVTWTHISVPDAEKRSQELFRKAEKTVKKLMSLNEDCDESVRLRLKKLASESSQRAEHLQHYVEECMRKPKKHVDRSIDSDYMCFYEGKKKVVRKISSK